MSEMAKTATYVVTAVVLLGLALVTQPRGYRQTGIFDDSGKPFFSDLTDPEAATALEVHQYDEALGSTRPFKVQFRDNKWTIPSHNNYPADAKDRLAKTAGGIIGLTKDSVVSDKKEDHADLGVVDPYEESGSLKGRGSRIKLFDKNDRVLADLIVGKDVPDQTGFKYMRAPSSDAKDRTYKVKTDNLDLSVRFSDWIDTDLLELSAADISDIKLHNYQIMPVQGGYGMRDLGTTKIDRASDNKLVVEGVPEGMKTNEEKVNAIADAIADLKIVGVRPKPNKLTPELKLFEGQVLSENMRRLGFLDVDGKIYSNDGEVLVETKEGLVYTLRFGGVTVASGEELTAGSKDETAKTETKDEKKDAGKEAAKDAKADAKKDVAKDEKKEEKAEGKKDEAKSVENRFMLVSVTFDASKFPPIPDPAPEKKEEPAKDAKADAKDTKDVKADAKDSKDSKAEVKDAKAEAKDAKAEAKDAKAEAKDAKAEAKDSKAEAKEEKKDAKADDAETKKKAEEEEAKKKEEEAKKKQEEMELKFKREDREKKIKDGEKRAKELTARYADWFYVIPNESFLKIRVPKEELIAKIEEKPRTADGAPAPETPIPPATPAAETKKAEPKEEPKAESKEAPKAETKEAPKDEPKAAPKEEAKEAPKAEAKEESKVESKEAPKTEAKEEPKTEAKQ